jgi:hypothetical protein
MILCQPDVVSFLFWLYVGISVQNLTDVVSFFRTLCWSLKNAFMSARRCVIFYLTLCRSSGRFRPICECIFIKYVYKGKFTQISTIFLFIKENWLKIKIVSFVFWLYIGLSKMTLCWPDVVSFFFWIYIGF